MKSISHLLKFDPIYKEKIWGGHKIRTELGKDFGHLANCGESWEVSGVPGDISVIATGPFKGLNLTDLLHTYKGELVGEKVYKKFGDLFPLLIKFIDANADLSIQVHPNDELASERHNSFGKTEMWYIIQADEGAELISGFNRALDKDSYLEYFRAGKIMEILNREMAVNGDVFLLPAGRVHTIGKGLLLIEIQQTSDVTYRIFDFNRKDNSGKLRDLHTEKAVDAIDYTYYNHYKTNYVRRINEPVVISECPYFSTSLLHFNQTVSRTYKQLDSFVILICTEGGMTVKSRYEEIIVKKGETILIPAIIDSVELLPEGSFNVLETYVPSQL